MSPRYDYVCGDDHVTEARRGRECQAILCPACGKTAHRVPFYDSQFIICETGPKAAPNATRAGNIKDKHGRYRVSLFQEACADVDEAHEKREQEVGRELPAPPLYKEAVKRAKKVTNASPIG